MHESKRVHVCRCLKHTYSQCAHFGERYYYCGGVRAPIVLCAFDEPGKNDFNNNDRVRSSCASEYYYNIMCACTRRREWSSALVRSETKRNFFETCVIIVSARKHSQLAVCARTFCCGNEVLGFFRRDINFAPFDAESPLRPIKSQFCCWIFCGSWRLTGFGGMTRTGGRILLCCKVPLVSVAIIAPNGVFKKPLRCATC